METKSPGAASSKRWMIGLAVAAALLLGVLLFVAARASGNFVVRTVSYVVDGLATRSGLSPFLVRGLVVLLTIPFFWAVAKFTKGIFGFGDLKPSLKLYTNRHGIIIVAYVGVFFLSMYFASQDAYAFKWCAETPEGIRAFDGPGVDPVYGIELKPCTFDQRVALRQQRVGFRGPALLEISNPATFEFFDPASGRPRVWYAKSPEGRYELFDKPGKDPRTGEDLQPVDQTVVRDVVRQKAELDAMQEEQKRRLKEVAKVASAEAEKARAQAQENSFSDRYLNPAPARPAGRKRVVVLLSGGAAAATPLAQEFASALGERGIETADGLFRPEFAADGSAGRLIAGDWSLAKRLRLADYVDAILSVTISHSVALTGELDPNLRTASLTLGMKCLDVVNLRPCGSRAATVKGAGFSEPEALRASASNAATEIQTFVKTLGI